MNDIYQEIYNFISVCKQVDGFDDNRGIGIYEVRLNAASGASGIKRDNIIKEMVFPFISLYDSHKKDICNLNFDFLIEKDIKLFMKEYTKDKLPLGKIYKTLKASKDEATITWIQYSIVTILSLCFKDDEDLVKAKSNFSEEQSKDVESVTMNIFKEITKSFSNMKPNEGVKDVLFNMYNSDHMISTIESLVSVTQKNPESMENLYSKVRKTYGK